jgi:hypothetical protein
LQFQLVQTLKGATTFSLTTFGGAFFSAILYWCNIVLSVALLRGIMRGIMLNAIELSGGMLSIIMLNAVQLSLVMLSVIILSVVKLNVIMLSVAMLRVVIQSVIYPEYCHYAEQYNLDCHSSEDYNAEMSCRVVLCRVHKAHGCSTKLLNYECHYF